jgi:hypothetical protein
VTIVLQNRVGSYEVVVTDRGCWEWPSVLDLAIEAYREQRKTRELGR